MVLESVDPTSVASVPSDPLPTGRGRFGERDQDRRDAVRTATHAYTARTWRGWLRARSRTALAALLSRCKATRQLVAGLLPPQARGGRGGGAEGAGPGPRWGPSPAPHALLRPGWGDRRRRPPPGQ